MTKDHILKLLDAGGPETFAAWVPVTKGQNIAIDAAALLEALIVWNVANRNLQRAVEAARAK